MRVQLLLPGLVLAGIVGALVVCSPNPRSAPPVPRPAQPSSHVPKLYWFVPDGMRADPDTFNVFRWAEEGKLPHLKRMMERGSYGYCRPVFPSHTPANFATLFTGAYPEVHGINDGPMRAEGSPLSQIAVPGFSSTAKKVEPMWVTLEKMGRGRVVLLSIPGSTPPELKNGITIRGRWGRWGADFHAVNFQDDAEPLYRQIDRAASRLFFIGPPLTQRVEKQPAMGWKISLPSHSPPLEGALTAWGATLHAAICDSTGNNVVDYDTVVFSPDKQQLLCTLKGGAWSEWLPITLKWQIPAQNLSRDVETTVKIKVSKIEPSGIFRIRFFYNNINRHLTEPENVAGELIKGAGPMVDFVDNFPAQLVFQPEDKETFLEEAGMSLDWHRRAAGFVLDHYQPDVFLHDIYTPNQMLTSRWWLGYVDPDSARYNDVSEQERARLWGEVHWLYEKLDAILGEFLTRASENAVVVLSSDHGAVPLNKQVRINNLFVREGLLKFSTNAQTGERNIDWPETKAVYLNMHNVYVSPEGLGGNWKRNSGPHYEQLRALVKSLLRDLQDSDGVFPLDKIVEWENASKELRLLPERVGDLIIANRAGYRWTEEITADLELFSVPRVSGSKQAILSENARGLWTPFVVMGPGIKKGHYLGEQPMEMVDQYPTIFRALGLANSAWVQGRVVSEVFE
ncbi:MAG: alkaline phosphatase family protein [Verrucomicrobiales bacterium]